MADGDVEKGENTYLVGLINANQPTTDPMADGGERSDRPRVATGKASSEARVRPAARPGGSEHDASAQRVDGDVDYTDSTMVVVTSAGAPPITLRTSGVGNQYYFTGAKLTLYEDYTLGGVSPNLQTQFNRARHYDPDSGRWLQRDPAEYVDGMSLYEYVRSRPTTVVDSMGQWGGGRTLLAD